ncbi:hypothetical protein [Methylibium sp.]|uniref:hypothetical protein n=1 Tax=Methylibium sp. TaxID=2067992 RepID=UPI003BACD81A
MIALALFASTFVLVMALGIQSLNVNGGHRLLACATSFAIGAANLVVLKQMPGHTTGLEIAAYLSGGPAGIWCAMALHPWLVRTLRRGTVPPDLSHCAPAPTSPRRPGQPD